MTTTTASYLTVPDLAAEWRCSERHIRDEIKRGNLRAVKIGARLLIDPADVAAYVDAHATVSAAAPRRTRRPRARAAS